jgi:hypothetical protein
METVKVYQHMVTAPIRAYAFALTDDLAVRSCLRSSRGSELDEVGVRNLRKAQSQSMYKLTHR